MKTKLIVLLCALSVAGVAYGQQTVDLDSLENRDEIYYYEGTPFTGIADGFDEKMKSPSPIRIDFVRGKGEGFFRGYYDPERTRVQWEVPMRGGRQEGMYVHYYKDGTTAFTVRKHKDKMEGKRHCYTEKGVLWHIHTYRHEKQHGLYTSFYAGSGKIFSQKRYRNDVRWGRVRIYYEQGGKLWEEGRYRNGKREGRWKKYAESGKLVRRIRYRNDEQISSQPIE